MLTRNLFDEVLLNPAIAGANHLHVISGYATPSIVYKQLREAKRKRIHGLKIDLIVGMASSDGVPRANHEQFRKLVEHESRGQFECRYLTSRPPVHAKVYVWCRDDSPLCGFVGSANYSHNGFFVQREAIASENPADCLSYFRALLGNAISCLDPSVEQTVKMTDDLVRRARQVAHVPPVTALPQGIPPEDLGFQPVRISLLADDGTLPSRSGLNWGQRPEYRRNPNQAYIHVPAEIGRSGFFPPRKQHFTIITDDGDTLDAVIAQDKGKAIHTTFDNSLLGRYFRKRLGLPDGQLVVLEDLNRYGRTDIDFVRIDDETYYMNFSVSRG